MRGFSSEVSTAIVGSTCSLDRTRRQNLSIHQAAIDTFVEEQR